VSFLALAYTALLKIFIKSVLGFRAVQFLLVSEPVRTKLSANQDYHDFRKLLLFVFCSSLTVLNLQFTV